MYKRQVLKVDSVVCDFNAYPYRAVTYATQKIIRQSNVTAVSYTHLHEHGEQLSGNGENLSAGQKVLRCPQIGDVAYHQDSLLHLAGVLDEIVHRFEGIVILFALNP